MHTTIVSTFPAQGLTAMEASTQPTDSAIASLARLGLSGVIVVAFVWLIHQFGMRFMELYRTDSQQRYELATRAVQHLNDISHKLDCGDHGNGRAR